MTNKLFVILSFVIRHLFYIQSLFLMFVHHVFFWLKNPQSESDKTALKNGLETLKTIPNVALAHIGEPAATNRPVIDSSYSVSWLMFFDNEQAQEVYQEHPIHHQFIADCASLWEKVVVYDSIG